MLRPIAASYGANYVRYDRQGYSCLMIEQVTFTNRDIKIRDEHIESVTPTVWLWRRVFGNSKETFVSAKGLQLELNQSRASKSAPGPIPSIPEIVEQTDAVFRTLKRWIPAA